MIPSALADTGLLTPRQLQRRWQPNRSLEVQDEHSGLDRRVGLSNSANFLEEPGGLAHLLSQSGRTLCE